MRRYDLPRYMVLPAARPVRDEHAPVGDGLHRPGSADGRRARACGVLVSQNAGSGSLRGGGAPISEFVRLLADFLERPLVDETGLAGPFDFELQFTAERSATPGAAVPGGLGASSTPGDVASIFTAVQEQMGLRLDPSRGSVDVLVVDAIERPSAN